MVSPRTREGSQPGPKRHRLAWWAALGVVGLMPLSGCQVEYAGMTLPSPHYMNDDVQYFSPGPEMKYANTVAATQRAYMRSQGLDVPESVPTGPLGAPRPGAGMLDPQQQTGNVPANVNVSRSTSRTNDTPPTPPIPGMEGADQAGPSTDTVVPAPSGGNP